MTISTPSRRLASSFLAAVAACVTLDGTSGSNSISTAYTLSGNTTFDLGFFVDYLIVGGGGATWKHRRWWRRRRRLCRADGSETRPVEPIP